MILGSSLQRNPNTIIRELSFLFGRTITIAKDGLFIARRKHTSLGLISRKIYFH
jgi:hypothetical protein